jgi:hypothetical protein
MAEPELGFAGSEGFVYILSAGRPGVCSQCRQGFGEQPAFRHLICPSCLLVFLFAPVITYQGVFG